MTVTLWATIAATAATTNAPDAADSHTGAAAKAITAGRPYTGAHRYIYRLTLRDKAGTTGRTDRPAAFLSQRAIERRRRQNIGIDSTDLPVSRTYLRQISRTKGVAIAGTSRWQNTVLVAMADSTAAALLRDMPCVTGCRMVWQAPDSVRPVARYDVTEGINGCADSTATSRYGAAAAQIDVCCGRSMHEGGWRGQGMTIAVLDGGFMNADCIPLLDGIDILGRRDFVYAATDNDFHSTDHGTKVLSVMGTYRPDIYIGTAPGAAYWLLRCEDIATEQPVEEDYWTMAAEYADSVGADIVSSSLGYTQFDHHRGDYTYRHQDGRSAFISRSASMMAGKGMVLVNSAGNSGMGTWKKIGFPADAHDIITVGAVNEMLQNAPFSSVGPTQDGRIKPDVMAQGSPTSVISGRGTIVPSMGTSFSTPLVAGLVACIWQAHKELTAHDIIALVRSLGDRHDCPDNIFGYGVMRTVAPADMHKAGGEENGAASPCPISTKRGE